MATAEVVNNITIIFFWQMVPFDHQHFSDIANMNKVHGHVLQLVLRVHS